MDPVRAAGARGAALRAPAARLMAADAAAVQALRGGRWPVAGPCRRAGVPASDMRMRLLLVPSFLMVMVAHLHPAAATLVKLQAPPLGWNSFLFGDGSNTYSVPNTTESLSLLKGFTQNLLPAGFSYFVIDGGWGLPNATDAYGRPVASPHIYPDLPKGSFAPIGDAVHKAGAKFGIWWMHGVSRDAVARQLPVKGTNFTTDQIVEGGQPRELCTAVPDYGCGDADIPGASVQDKNFTSAAECCAVCKTVKGCTAWSWNSGYKNKGCYPKYNCEGGRANSGCTSGFAAAHRTPACSWTNPPLNYKLNTSHPGAKAFYASLVETWENWQIDLVKIDCVFGVNMQLDDIALFSQVMDESKREFVLSLSPQGGDYKDIQAVKKLATFARITGDFHRNWHQTYSHFATAALLANETGDGFFLDLDLLPFGMEMGYPPNEPPWTPNRGMAFWPPVRRSIVSLWVMASSPLFYSGDVRSDSKDAQGNPYWTQELSELLTNKKVLAAHQDLRGGGQVSATNSTVVWAADCAATVQGSATAAICRYVAVFNVWCGEPRKADPPCPVAPWGNGTLATTLQLPDLGVGSISRLHVEDLWNSSGSFTVPAGKKSVTAHTEHLGATLWKVTSSPAIRIKTDTTEVRLKTDEEPSRSTFSHCPYGNVSLLNGGWMEALAAWRSAPLLQQTADPVGLKTDDDDGDGEWQLTMQPPVLIAGRINESKFRAHNQVQKIGNALGIACLFFQQEWPFARTIWSPEQYYELDNYTVPYGSQSSGGFFSVLSPFAFTLDTAGSWLNPNQSPKSKMLPVPPTMTYHAEHDPPGTLRSVAGDALCACAGHTCEQTYSFNRTMTIGGDCLPVADGGTVLAPPWVNFTSSRSLVWSTADSATIQARVESRHVLFYGLPSDHGAWPNCSEPKGGPLPYGGTGPVPDARITTDEDPIRLADGSLLTVMYVCLGGRPLAFQKGRSAFTLVVFRSVDDGLNYKYQGVLANPAHFADPADPLYSVVGTTSEVDFAQLADGHTLTAVWRPDGDCGCLTDHKVPSMCGRYSYYWESFSSDMGVTWTKPIVLKGMGCVKPRLLALGPWDGLHPTSTRDGPLVLSGGRICIENITGIFLWLNSDGMAGWHTNTVGAGSWQKYDLTDVHNRLWKGDPVYKYDAQINNSGVFASQSYTTLIQTAPYEFVVTYNKYFHPVDGASGCMDPAVDGPHYGAPCSTAFSMKVTASRTAHKPQVKTDDSVPRNLMMSPAAAASAAAAERPCSVTAGGFGDNAQVVIMPNSTTPPASAIYTGPGARQIFSVSGPNVDSIATLVANSTAASLQQQLPGDHDEVYVTLGLDLQPPLGRHTYIDGVTITFELSGADTSLAQFGLRRVAVDETCCGSTGGVNGMMQDFCDGVYTARVPPSESAASGAQQTTVDRSHIAYVARNASRGAAFIHSSMSPDGQMVLEIVLNLKAASTGVTMRAVGVTTLRILKVTYQYPPLAVEDACALVVPWSEHGHGSIGGLWLMFYPGNNMTLIGNGYLQERWEDECCFDPPAEPRCEPTYELNQSISSLQYLGSGGGWIEGNYPPIGHTNKFFRLEGAGDAAQGRVTITQRQCGAQYNLAYSPIPFEALEPNVAKPLDGISALSPMAEWDPQNRSVRSRTRAGRPWECGSGPHWNCGACMVPSESQGEANCSDPTYANSSDIAAKQLGPCMAQFNRSAPNVAVVAQEVRKIRKEIVRLQERLAQLLL